MWDYNKLFTDGNIIGIKNCYRGKVFNNAVNTTTSITWLEGYKNEELSCKNQYVDVDDKIKHGYTTDFEIQYIIRLDEHGNVAEKIFDRERDIDSKKMPELKDGIFIRIAEKDNLSDDTLAYVDLNKDKLIFQDGGHESVSRISKWNFLKVVEVYDEDCINFDTCRFHKPIWRDFEYENYLEKVNK